MNYKLVKSFEIDDGQLDGESAQECFVLGYELANVDCLLTNGESIQRPIHVQNRERIENSCRKAGRQFKISWFDQDESESWLWLEVDTK